MQSSPWAVYPRRHLFPNYEEKTQFVWKSIWLNLQEVATCSSVYLQPPNNCVSLQQIKTQINWSGLSESNWFEHIGSLVFFYYLHLCTWLNILHEFDQENDSNILIIWKNISIHELFIRGREDQTLYQESPARNFDMRRLWRHFRPMNFPNTNWNKFSSQCYISTAVWLALLFLYFHKLNCGEVNQLFPFHSMLDVCFLFGVTWLDIYFMLSTNPWLIQKFPCFRFGNWC